MSFQDVIVPVAIEHFYCCNQRRVERYSIEKKIGILYSDDPAQSARFLVKAAFFSADMNACRLRHNFNKDDRMDEIPLTERPETGDV